MRSAILLLCLLVPACSGKKSDPAVAVNDAPKDDKPREIPKPTLKTVDLSEQGIRILLDMPAEVAVEPQVDGGVLLSKPKGFAVRIDRQPAGFALGEQEEFDADHAATFFGTELDATMRLQYDKFAKDASTQLEGRLQPGKSAYSIHISGPFSPAEIDAMVAVLATARIDDAIRDVERKQEEAAVALAKAGVRLERKGNLACLNLTKPLLAELLPQALALADIGGIAFSQYAFTDADVMPFAALRQVRRVSLESPAVTEKVFETIGRWPWLRELELVGAPITGFGFERLRGAKNLRRLDVEFCPLRSSALQNLAEVPLESVYLGGTDITDSACDYLGKIGTLRELGFVDNRIDGRGIEGLAKLPNLKSLVFVGCPLEPVAFRTIAACPKLEKLALGRMPLAERDMAWLGGMASLAEFSVFAADFDGRAIETLGVGPKLKAVNLFTTVLPPAVEKSFREKYPQVALKFPVPEPEPEVLPVTPPKPPNELPAPDPRGRVEKLGGTVKVAEEVEGKPIVGISLRGTAATDLDLAELRGLVTLETLDITNCPVSDAGLYYLKDLKNLATLKLAGTHVGGDGLIFLKNLKKLSTLELPSGGFTLKQLAPLAELTALERALTDAGTNPVFKLRQFAGLKELREFTFTGSGEPDRDTFRWLLQFPKLEKLTIIPDDFPASWFSTLGELKELRTLEIYHIGYSRTEDWKPLAGLKELRELMLEGSKVDDSKLTVLRELSNLEKLTLNCPRVTDKGIGRISSFGKLHQLSLATCAITDATLAGFADLKELEELDLIGTRITDAGLAKLKELEELRTLKLSGISGKGLEALRGLPRLRTLELRDARFIDGSADAIRGIRSLIDVSLPGCAMKLSDVETILALPELRKLVLPKFEAADAAKLAELSKKYPGVKIIQ